MPDKDLDFESPKKQNKPFSERLPEPLIALWEGWVDADNAGNSYSGNKQAFREERTASRWRVALLVLLGLLLFTGIAGVFVTYAPALIALVAVSLGLSTLGVGFLAIGIGALLGVALLAGAENLRLGKFPVAVGDKANLSRNYVHKQRQTYLRTVIFASLLLAGMGLGIFLAGAFPAVLGIFAAITGPGFFAMLLAGAAGALALGLLANLVYAVIVLRYERNAREYSTEKSSLSFDPATYEKSSFLAILNRHPLLFRLALGTLIALSVSALVALSPGVLTAFAVSVGLSVGSPLALLAAVGTVALLSAVFGIEIMGFVELRFQKVESKVFQITASKEAIDDEDESNILEKQKSQSPGHRSTLANLGYTLLPATIAGAALGVFLAATVFPGLLLLGPGLASFALAGALGLAASLLLAALPFIIPPLVRAGAAKYEAWQTRRLTFPEAEAPTKIATGANAFDYQKNTDRIQVTPPGKNPSGPGWGKFHDDETNSNYFYNHVTKETRWEVVEASGTLGVDRSQNK